MVKPQRKGNSQKELKDEDVDILAETVNYIKQNWKTILITLTIFGLAIYMKVQEERSFTIREKKNQINPYKVLGVSKSTSGSDIKKAFMKLASELHPDNNQSCKDCSQKFENVKEAYEILSSPERKADYDIFEGSTEPLPSSTSLLTENDLYSDKPLIIQVFDEISHGSQAFSSFWEDFADVFDFLSFKRVHNRRQQNIIKKLPFAIDELPFVIAMFPGRPAEVLEFLDERSPNSAFNTLLRQSIGRHFQDYTLKDLIDSKSKLNKEMFLILKTGLRPIFFDYATMRLSNWILFGIVKTTDRKEAQDYFKGNDKTEAITIKSSNAKRVNLINQPIEKEGFKKSLNSLLTNNTIEMDRLAFEELCSVEGFVLGGKSPIMSNFICVMTLESRRSDWISKALNIFSEYINKIQTSDILRPVQFGRLILKDHNQLNSVIPRDQKFLIFETYSNRYRMTNSFDDLNDIIEDYQEGFFEEFTSINNLINGEDFGRVLRDNRVSFWSLVIQEIFSKIFFKVCLSIIIWLVLRKTDLNIYRVIIILLSVNLLFSVIQLKQSMAIYGI